MIVEGRPTRIMAPAMPQSISVPSIPAASFRLPPQLEGLRRIAYNFWWAWHPRAQALFSRIDAPAWSEHRNPIPILTGPVAWTPLLDDPAFMAEYEDVLAEFDACLQARRRYPSVSSPVPVPLAAPGMARR